MRPRLTFRRRPARAAPTRPRPAVRRWAGVAPLRGTPTIRQRLSLLVMLPLAMSVLTVVPFTVDRISTARSAGATAQQIRDRTVLAGVVQALQTERVLDLAYLTVNGTDRNQVLAAQQASVEVADRSGYAAQVTTLAGIALTILVTVRQHVLDHTEDAGQLYRAFQEAIDALLAAVPLVSQPTTASSGVRQLITIDALLRADEQANGQGAALLVILNSPADGVALLASGITATQQELDLLHRTATPAQASAVDAVNQGTLARRVGLIEGVLSGPTGGGLTVAPNDVLAAVTGWATLRRLVEVQVIDSAEAQVTADARSAALTAAVVGGLAVLVLVLVIVLTVRLSHSISARLRRLTRAVGVVADVAGAELVRVFDEDEQTDPPRLVGVDLRGTDELAELAAGFNRVQSTAVLLLQRQMNTRRNVAVMFTNIARRTQHLVGRQLALLDNMERDERDARLLDNLYRLDHIATRLSRSADSLLVIAGTPEEGLSAPLPLLDVVRAGTAEIERFQAVRVGRVIDVVVSPQLAGDLRLLLAELLENATAASPPGVSVDVGAELDGDACRISVVDRGIGMSAARIAEENRRMVELPRLETAPTQSLGLFVVGRLARRHGLTVRLHPTLDRGVTVTVSVPRSLLTSATGQLPAAAAAPPVDRGITRATQVLPTALAAAALRAAAELAIDPNFDWFRADAQLPELPAAQVPELPAAQVPELPAAPARGTAVVPDLPTVPLSRGELRRRTPGQSSAVFDDPADGPGRYVPRDAAAEASAAAAFDRATRLTEEILAAAAGRAADPDPAAPTRGGLQRRVPGANLADGARTAPPDTGEPPATRRDPAAERADLDGFVSGLARADRDSSDLDVLSQERNR